MKRWVVSLAIAGAVLAACSDAGGVDADAIDTQEMAAVRTALDSALKDDSAYLSLRLFVFQYVDRASHVVDPQGDSTRLVVVQLDIDAMKADTEVVAQLSSILAWRGYHATTRTVDTVYFVAGAGIAPPIDDSLRTRFSPDTAGTGTGFVIHQAPDSSITSWLARAGAMHLTAASYGSGRSQSAGGVTLTTYRGTVSGDYHMTARLVPDSLTTVTSAADFGSGARALLVRITGTLP